MPTESLTREVFGNIGPVSQGVFYALTAASVTTCCYGISRRVRMWNLGRKAEHPVNWGLAFKRLFTEMVLQRSVYRGRVWAGRAHLLMFSGFTVLLVGTVLIAIEHYGAAVLGREATDPWFHKGVYFALYEMVLDAFGLALLVGCAWFVARRWQGSSSIGHNRLDWVLLGMLVVLIVTGYLIEGLRIIREGTPQPAFSFVGFGVATVFGALGATPSGASAIHFALWWLHAVFALGFVAVFPYTRLMHVIAGTVNIATGTKQLGHMVPISMEDVLETGLVGVGRLQEFTRRQLVQLDACVSCGRCQDACPAYEAAKPLSPRDVVQDLRRHMNRIAAALRATRRAGGAEDEPPARAPSLDGEVIAAETLWACTTCSACVDVCPLGVDPLELLTDLRRNRIGEGELRGPPAQALQKLQRSGNPWGMPREDRFNWADGLNVPTVKDNPNFEVLYWVGCAAAYDRRIQNVARAVVKLFQAAHVNFAVLGPEERCTGESARRMGDEFLFQQLAESNLQTLAQYKVKRIVTHCPHCLNSFQNDYRQFGGEFEVMHHSQLLAELIDRGRLPINRETMTGFGGNLTYHDPCYLARVNHVIAPPRELIDLTIPAGGTNKLIEMPRHGRETSCCGAGGGRMWFDDTSEGRVGLGRVEEAVATGAKIVAVSCPFCLRMMSDGVAARDADVQVKDIAELLAYALGTDWKGKRN